VGLSWGLESTVHFDRLPGGTEIIRLPGYLEVNMSKNEPQTCAHLPCRCVVPAGEKYCGQSCEEAGSEEVEIACECDHPPACALTATEESVA
jgi:hypothetical protein